MIGSIEMEFIIDCLGDTFSILPCSTPSVKGYNLYLSVKTVTLSSLVYKIVKEWPLCHKVAFT